LSYFVDNTISDETTNNKNELHNCLIEDEESSINKEIKKPNFLQLIGKINMKKTILFYIICSINYYI